VTEAEARAVLAAFDGVAGLERQLAKQPWQADAGGWAVLGAIGGWRFRVEPAPGGITVFGSDGWGEPAVWFVPGRP
jgi:hypothetical protein